MHDSLFLGIVRISFRAKPIDSAKLTMVYLKNQTKGSLSRNIGSNFPCVGNDTLIHLICKNFDTVQHRNASFFPATTKFTIPR